MLFKCVELRCRNSPPSKRLAIPDDFLAANESPEPSISFSAVLCWLNRREEVAQILADNILRLLFPIICARLKCLYSLIAARWNEQSVADFARDWHRIRRRRTFFAYLYWG